MGKLWQKLKDRWGIVNDFQVVIILAVFSLTGFTTLFVHREIDALLGITPESHFGWKALVFAIIILPVFNVLLFLWGSILGQQKFFRWFIKEKLRLLKRILPLK
jgi:hypothetical protein